MSEWARLNRIMDELGRFYKAVVGFGFDFFQMMSGVASAIHLFTSENAVEIANSVFIVLVLLLIHVNPYVSLMLGIAYFIYHADSYFKKHKQIAEDSEFLKKQMQKRKLLRELPGFSKLINPQTLENLSELVYALFREDQGNDDVVLFGARMAEAGFDVVDKFTNEPSDEKARMVVIEKAMDDELNTGFAVSLGEKSLLALTGGTDTQARKTFIHDIDGNLPGRTVFKKHRDAIINPLIDVANKHNLTTINIAGHSFGAAISIMILDELLKEKLNGNLESVEVINCCAYSAAGVNDEVIKGINDSLVSLSEKYPEFKCHYIDHRHGGDPVPGSGKQPLLPETGNNEVFMVRRPIDFWIFLVLFFSWSLFKLTHKAFIYDQSGRFRKYDWLSHMVIRREKVVPVQYYRYKDHEDKKQMEDDFGSEPWKFVCNNTLYGWLTHFQPDFWRWLICAIEFMIVAGLFLQGLWYVVFMPDITRFVYCFKMVIPVLLSALVLYETKLPSFLGKNSNLPSDEVYKPVNLSLGELYGCDFNPKEVFKNTSGAPLLLT